MHHFFGFLGPEEANMVEPIRDHWLIALALIALASLIVWILVQRRARPRKKE